MDSRLPPAVAPLERQHAHAHPTGAVLWRQDLLTTPAAASTGHR
jgi:hypothetical protein